VMFWIGLGVGLAAGFVILWLIGGQVRLPW
jgi:hypothetical protein